MCYDDAVNHQTPFFMTLKYSRIQAGEYQINDGTKMVGYIQKKSSKWILYKCTNPSVLGNPIAVKKTLKELKVEAEALIDSSAPSSAEVTQKPLTAKTPKSVAPIRDMKTYDPEKYEMMKEMLDRDYVIDISKYKHVDDGLEEIDLDECDFLTEEELAAL